MRWTLCQLGPPIQYAQICGLLTLKLKSGRLEFAAERLGEKALKQPETIAKLNAEGSEALGGSPQRFADFLKTEHARWGALVKESGAQAD